MPMLQIIFNIIITDTHTSSQHHVHARYIVTAVLSLVERFSMTNMKFTNTVYAVEQL